MILDSSVIVALGIEEPGFPALVEKLETADALAVGTPTLVESSMVLQSRVGAIAGPFLENFLEDFVVEVVPFGAKHWREAFRAFRLYGKGRHPAHLNFGDCMSYATAKVADRPLLFIGDDFSKTDLESA